MKLHAQAPDTAPPDEPEIVFGYYYEGPGEMAIAPAEVYHPTEIVAEALDSEAAAPRLDYAWLHLDRPVSPPHEPARVFVRTSGTRR